MVKHSTPRPIRPAFSNVPGLPAATQSGGCGLVTGLGEISRAGTGNDVPWYSYTPSRHILGISRMDSSHMSFDRSISGIPKPYISVLDDPRPVPSSNLPFERLSSIAARSAERTGWLTGAVMLKIADPRWTRDVRAATNERNTSGDDMCEYCRRKWCSDAQTYLKLHSSART